MPFNTPFAPMGKTISLQTSGSASTSQSRQVQASDFGLSTFPNTFRIVNNGTSDVWISFTNASATISIPTPGTTTVGNPQACWRLKPGVIEAYSFPEGMTPVYINDISTGTGQIYDVTPGEGQ